MKEGIDGRVAGGIDGDNGLEKQKTPEISRVGHAYAVETPNGQVTAIEIGESKRIVSPDGKELEVAKALRFPFPPKKLLETIKEMVWWDGEPANEYDPVWRKVMKNIAQVLAPFGGLAFVGGCINASNNSGTNPDDPSGINQALTADDLNHMGQIHEAAFTEPGDEQPNIGTFNGEIVITFANASGREGSSNVCYYVKASDITVALAEPQTVKKFNFPYSSAFVDGCMVFNNQIVYRDSDTWVADLTEDPDGGLNVAENPQKLPRQRIDGGNTELRDGYHRTIAPQNGTNTPLLLSSGLTNINSGSSCLIVRDLNTNQITLYPDIATYCGTPHRVAEDEEWVGGVFDTNRDSFIPVKCYLSNDTGFNISGNNHVSIPGTEMDWDGGTEGFCDLGRCGIDLMNPRIFQDVVIAEGRMEKLPPDPVIRRLDKSKIYYSKVQPYPEDGGIAVDGGFAQDGGAVVSDGGVRLDGGFVPDGGTQPDAGIQPNDGGTPAGDGGPGADGGLIEADGGTQPDAGIQQNDGGTGINAPAGCCNVSNSKPTGVAGLVLLVGAAIVRLLRRRVEKSPKAKTE